MATALQPFRDALTAAKTLTKPIPGLSVTHRIDRVRFTGTLALSALPVTELDALSTRGHLVDLRIEANDWSVHLRRGGQDGEVTETSGPTSAAVEQSKIDDLERALAAKDFDAIVALLRRHDTEITLEVINDPQASGAHWLASSQSLTALLASEPWVPLARKLATGPTVLILDDLGDTVMANPAITVCGPAADHIHTNERDRDTIANSDAVFRTSRADKSQPYPSPMVFANWSGGSRTCFVDTSLHGRERHDSRRPTRRSVGADPCLYAGERAKPCGCGPRY